MSDREDPTGDERTERLDFFGASPSPTRPVPTTPPPGPGPATTPQDRAPAPLPAVTPGPDAGAPTPEPLPLRRGVRVRTLVFGVVMLVISGASLVGLLTSVRLDGGVVTLAVLIGAGAALLVGGLSAAVRDIRRGGPRFG